MPDFVRTERRGRVLEITLDRPKANAINRQVSQELYDAFKNLQDDTELSVGIIRSSSERFFSAGWDLKEETDDYFDGSGAEESPGGFAGITEFWDLNKPVVAAVNGYCIGGGFEIALAADIIVCGDSAEFRLPELQRGFLPDSGAIQRLPRRIPYNIAVEMFYTGRALSAAEASQWGLVRQVVPKDVLLNSVREISDQIAKSAPLALQALKEVLQSIECMPIREAVPLIKPGKSGMPMYEKMCLSEDAKEGPRAFAEKREPVWTSQ